MGQPDNMNQSSENVCSPKRDYLKNGIERNNSDICEVIDLNCKGISIFPKLDSSLSLSLPLITCLNLNNNKLMMIPCGLHNVIPSLQILSVDDNQLSELPMDICEFMFLQELHICRNKLTMVPNSLYKLKHLRILNVSHNELKSLHPEIGQNDCLEELFASDNYLKRFPATLGLLKNLRVIKASNNKVEHISQTIHFLKNLQVVNLKCNKLTSIPDSFSLLENIRHVDLSENKLSELWPSFLSTHCLERIMLDSNLINVLPSWLSQLDKVREISVSRNNLWHSDSLPTNFGNRLQNLEKLDLRGNFIEKLPQSFSCLTGLKTLLLGTTPINTKEENDVFQNANWLTALPSNFTDLKHLVFLEAEQNQLAALPQDFGCLVFLKDLRLGGNILTSLPKSFCKLVSLEKCQLSKNKLRSLPEEFGQLDDLKELYLDFNKLKTFPLSIKNCVLLEVLDLRGNKLSQASTDILKSLTHIKDLKLVQEIECDIELEMSNDCASYSDDEFDDCTFAAATLADSWDDEEDYEDSRSGSSTHDVILVKDDEENWDEDLDTCNPDTDSNNGVGEAETGQFDLDGEDTIRNRSLGMTFDVYGNASQRIDLSISQHRMLPYLLHQPKNVWGQREAAQEEQENQYDDDDVS